MKNLNWWLEWTATFTAIAGAISTVLKLDPLNIFLLNGSCVLFVIWAFRIQRTSLIVVNGGLLLVYLVGIIMRM